MPLLQTIRTFEVNKRNSDVTVAIRDKFTTAQEITVTPKKTKLNVGESVDVDIEMIDCDGVPLGNRDISFVGDPEDSVLMIPSTTGGTVEPSTVTTDGSGKATVKFTAGSTAGADQIVASYRHYKPCGRLSAFLGTAAIVVGQPVIPLWVVNASIMEQVDRRIDTTWTSVNGSDSRLVTEISSGFGRINALIENGGNDTTGFFFVAFEEYGDTFDNATVSGIWGQNYYKRFCTEAGGLPPSVDIQVKGYSGSLYLGSGQTGFEFHYPNNPSDVAIVAQAGGMAQGTSLTKYTYCCPEYHWEQSTNNNPTSGGVYTEFNADECTITRSGMKYTISGSRTTVTRSSEQKTTRSIELFATVSLHGTPTGVDQMRDDLPGSYDVQQNFPNPFNPSTTITYDVPKQSRVRILVYDILGREVETLVDEMKKAGRHRVTWNVHGLASGVYFYRLQAEDYCATKKLLLLK